jgi:hypothetical protein
MTLGKMGIAAMPVALLLQGLGATNDRMGIQ